MLTYSDSSSYRPQNDKDRKNKSFFKSRYDKLTSYLLDMNIKIRVIRV